MTQRTPPYPLQAVLDQLHAERERGRGAVADALDAAHAARQRLDDARAAREDAQTRTRTAERAITAAIENGAAASDVQRRCAYADARRHTGARLSATVAAAAVALRDAEAEVARGRTALTDADHKLELQNRHRDRHLANLRRRRQRQEQNEADELGRMLHQRQTRSEPRP